MRARISKPKTKPSDIAKKIGWTTTTPSLSSYLCGQVYLVDVLGLVDREQNYKCVLFTSAGCSLQYTINSSAAHPATIPSSLPPTVSTIMHHDKQRTVKQERRLELVLSCKLPSLSLAEEGFYIPCTTRATSTHHLPLDPDVEKNRLWVLVLSCIDVHRVVLPHDAVGVVNVPEDVNLLVVGSGGLGKMSMSMGSNNRAGEISNFRTYSANADPRHTYLAPWSNPTKTPQRCYTGRSSACSLCPY